MWEQAKQIFLESLQRTALAVAASLPGILVLVLVLLLALMLAAALRAGVRRFLAGIDFDRRVKRWGVGSLEEWLPSQSPAAMISRVVYWLTLLIGFLVGLNAIDAALTHDLAMRALAYLPQVVVAVVIFLAGLVGARFLERAVLISAVNMQLRSARVLALGVKWLVMVMVIAMSLDHLGIGGSLVTISFSILFGGTVLGLALALGLGSRDAVGRAWARRTRDREAEEESGEEEIRHL